MSTKDDGGPAFPVPEMHVAPNTKQACESQGMTLRDWFAGMALQGLLSGDEHGCYSGLDWAERLAYNALQAADAMLAARKAEP